MEEWKDIFTGSPPWMATTKKRPSGKQDVEIPCAKTLCQNPLGFFYSFPSRFVDCGSPRGLDPNLVGDVSINIYGI